MKRRHFSTNTPWEPLAGYSRALRVGPHVFVSGTTATDETGELVKGDAYAQTVQVLKNIETALGGVGATFAHVVRTRIYITNVEDWEAVARAHGEVFGTRPTRRHARRGSGAYRPRHARRDRGGGACC